MLSTSVITITIVPKKILIFVCYIRIRKKQAFLKKIRIKCLIKKLDKKKPPINAIEEQIWGENVFETDTNTRNTLFKHEKNEKKN